MSQTISFTLVLAGIRSRAPCRSTLPSSVGLEKQLLAGGHLNSAKIHYMVGDTKVLTSYGSLLPTSAALVQALKLLSVYCANFVGFQLDAGKIMKSGIMEEPPRKRRKTEHFSEVWMMQTGEIQH